MSKVSDERRIEKVKERHEKNLFLLSNVVGVGIGYKTIKDISTNKLCLKVYVEKKLPPTRLAKDEIIPARLDGIETDIEEAGRLKAE